MAATWGTPTTWADFLTWAGDIAGGAPASGGGAFSFPLIEPMFTALELDDELLFII